MAKYRDIFFDLDHTLWDFDANSKETLGELFIELSLSERTRVNFDYFFERYITHNERCWDLYRQDRISKSRLRSARFEFALSDIGIKDKKLAKRFGDLYIEHGPKKTKLVEGAAQILKQLRSEYKLHILSNGFHEGQLTKLKFSGIHDYFDHVITSEKASAKKPNSRIYDYAQSVTAALPESTLMIGDNLEIDVIGAISSGWDAIHYNPKGVVHDYKSIKDLAELSAILL